MDSCALSQSTRSAVLPAASCSSAASTFQTSRSRSASSTVGRRAGRDGAPAGHHHDLVGDRRGEREVVHHEHDAEPVLARARRSSRAMLGGGAEVQVRGRLVGDQHGRLLGERDRDLHALQLAARQRAAVGGRRTPRRRRARARPATASRSARVGRCERPDVRRAADADRLAHADAVGHAGALGHERADAARAAGRAARLTSSPRQRTLPPASFCSPATARTSVDLPAPLGPTTATSCPASSVRSAPCRIGVPPIVHAHVAWPRAASHRLPQQPQEQRHAEHHHERADGQLDRREHRARERVARPAAAPRRSARRPARRSRGADVPPAIRTRCGTTSPRKASSPAMRRRRGGEQRGGDAAPTARIARGRAPSEAATSSPSASRSSGRISSTASTSPAAK